MINKCLVCNIELDEKAKQNGIEICSQYCDAKYSGYPMPYDYSEVLQTIINNLGEGKIEWD